MPSEFEEMCAVLQTGHRKGTDSPTETLNRLFHKHINNHKPEFAHNPPLLSVANVRLNLESWSLERLKGLLPEETDRGPRATNSPLVVVHFQNRDCLIDGRRRINMWIGEGNTGDHMVWVLRVLEYSN